MDKLTQVVRGVCYAIGLALLAALLLLPSPGAGGLVGHLIFALVIIFVALMSPLLIAWAIAATVRWINRRDPDHAKRPPDSP